VDIVQKQKTKTPTFRNYRNINKIKTIITIIFNLYFNQFNYVQNVSGNVLQLRFINSDNNEIHQCNPLVKLNQNVRFEPKLFTQNSSF
jgi:hypothetical protein